MYLYAHNARIYAYIHVYRAKMETLVYKLTEDKMREKEIEKKLVDGIKRLGGCAYKWVSPGRDGVPDRIVVLPGGIIWFVELKTDTGRLSPRQQFQLNFLSSLGFNTTVVRGMSECRQFLLDREKEVELRGV